MAIATTGLRETLATAYGSAASWVSVHPADPGATGVPEASGGSPLYARKQTVWAPGVVDGVNIGSQVTIDVGAGTYTHVGLWTAVTGGVYRDSAAIPGGSVTVAGQSTLKVTPTVTVDPAGVVSAAAPFTGVGSLTAAVAPTGSGSGWVPTPGVQWQWQLASVPTTAELNTAYASGARAFDIDADGATIAKVNEIHALGAGVGAVGYIDVGGWESYRADAAAFPESVKGNAMVGWPEQWLDVRQLAILGPIMAARIQVVADKGFDGVEPDLLDGYQNNTGFPITYADQIAYNRMIADLAHAAGLTVAQKGDNDQCADLEPYFDWVLNEQCGEMGECNTLLPYKNAGKAVWIVEYQAGHCAAGFPIAGQAAMLKNVNLTAPRTPCLS